MIAAPEAAEHIDNTDLGLKALGSTVLQMG